jgi:fused signal recognition particle receptor
MAKGKKLKEPRPRRRDRKERKAEEAAESESEEAVAELEAEGELEPVPAEHPAEHPAEPELQGAPSDEVTIVVTGEYTEEEEPEDEVEGEDGDKKGLRKGMFRSRRVLSRPFVRAATRKAIDPEFWVEAEEALIAADAGPSCAVTIVEGARQRILSEGIKDIDGLKGAFKDEVADTLRSFGERPPLSENRPHVIFVVGVNGVGKTTTTAKIGNLYKENGYKVLFAAADTFRAAGIEQMEMWAQRVGAPVVRHKTGGDPAAVVYDSLESARARGIDVVLVDTAGRLHTKKNLMDELNKMWRVAERQLDEEPESILVIDATTGQNGVSQARIFGEAMPLGSIALTKMDGSAKGGVVLAIGSELGIPVAYIGVGEGLADLRPFDPDAYARALF